MPESDATKQEIRFHGNLGPEDEQAARFAASITYDQYDPTTLNVEILWLGNEESNRIAAQKLSIPRSIPLTLYAEDPLSPDVELLGISKITTGGNRAKIRTDAVRVGIT